MADDLKGESGEKQPEEETSAIQEDLDGSEKSHPAVATLEKTLQHLQFRNPGPMLQDFNPEKSEREKRKLVRMLQQQKQKADKHRKKNLYDEAGVLISDGRDLCDCLEEECPGCHYPCPKCGSEKCGAECRCNRRWHYEWIESECRHTTRKFKQV